MEFTIHLQILAIVLVTGMVMGAVANKTNFCTMGAVSDWVNMGDTGRLRVGIFDAAAETFAAEDDDQPVLFHRADKDFDAGAGMAPGNHRHIGVLLQDGRKGVELFDVRSDEASHVVIEIDRRCLDGALLVGGDGSRLITGSLRRARFGGWLIGRGLQGVVDAHVTDCRTNKRGQDVDALLAAH